MVQFSRLLRLSFKFCYCGEKKSYPVWRDVNSLGFLVLMVLRFFQGCGSPAEIWRMTLCGHLLFCSWFTRQLVCENRLVFKGEIWGRLERMIQNCSFSWSSWKNQPAGPLLHSMEVYICRLQLHYSLPFLFPLSKHVYFLVLHWDILINVLSLLLGFPCASSEVN